MNSILDMGPEHLELFNLNVAAGMFDLDKKLVWASKLFLELAGNERAGGATTVQDEHAWAEFEAQTYPGSPLIGNGAQMVSECLDLARELGHYTQVFWICNPRQELLRVISYNTYAKGKGFTRILCPMEDPSLPAYSRFDWHERKWYITVCTEGFTEEDLNIYEGLCSGLSYDSVAQQLGIPPSRVKYRGGQLAFQGGHRNLTAMRMGYVAGTTDLALPTLRTTVHGHCECLVPSLPAEYGVTHETVSGTNIIGNER